MDRKHYSTFVFDLSTLVYFRFKFDPYVNYAVSYILVFVYLQLTPFIPNTKLRTNMHFKNVFHKI